MGRLDTVTSGTGDSALARLLLPYRTEMGQQFEQVIGQLSVPLRRGSNPDSLGQKLLWNHVTDACLAFARDSLGWAAEGCLLNSGGLRADLSPGPVRVIDVFELLPFDNTLVLSELDSVQWLEMQRHLEARFQPQSGWVWDIEGDRHQLLRRGRSYPVRLVTIDYLTDGGDRMDFLKNTIQQRSGIVIRDAYLWYWKRHPEEQPAYDDRGRRGGTSNLEP
ncbi:hypothetical protein GC167_00510 [bacterium]|nr:hypothetical protein [bacterium]